jgi:hypothetical protein
MKSWKGFLLFALPVVTIIWLVYSVWFVPLGYFSFWPGETLVLPNFSLFCLLSLLNTGLLFSEIQNRQTGRWILATKTIRILAYETIVVLLALAWMSLIRAVPPIVSDVLTPLVFNFLPINFVLASVATIGWALIQFITLVFKKARGDSGIPISLIWQTLLFVLSTSLLVLVFVAIVSASLIPTMM